jgi:predicted O-linked N-acetylglucosamine transferase (SPINDLY family)
VDIAAAFAAARQEQEAGQLAAAEAHYREILARDAQRPEVYYNLGLVLRSRGRLHDAAAAYEQALALQPRFPAAANNLGAVLASLGQFDEAEDMLRHSLLLDPAAAETWNNLGAVLKDLGRLDEAIGCLEHANRLEPANARFHSNLVFTLHYSPRFSAAALRQAAQRWDECHARPLGVAVPPAPNAPAPDRRLRIGYVSPYFRDHCQALFTVPLLAHHDHDRGEIFCYSDNQVPDGVTARLRGYADHWRETGRLSDAQLADLIRQDGIDVLVDLTLHLAHQRLLVFARRPAPVQLTWLGYPGTTGLAAMGHRLTDPWLDPAGTDEASYAEQSLRLPDSFWCYDPLTDLPPASAQPPLPRRRVTFGCLNNFCKVTDATLDLWARILAAVPASQILLLVPPGASRARVKARLGVLSDRVEFVGYQPRQEYLKLYHRIDLGLDTFPYNGHTTSLDALWMGVPVVSLSGTTAVSRAGLSLASTLGLPGLVAGTPDEFVAVAVALARDHARLAELKAGLRERMTRSPLMDAPRFARHVEHAYRVAWQAWCRSQPAGTGA